MRYRNNKFDNFGIFIYSDIFLPEEDQGIIFANIQLSDTASINETSKILSEMNDKILKTKGVKYFISVAGYSMLGAAVKMWHLVLSD